MFPERWSQVSREEPGATTQVGAPGWQGLSDYRSPQRGVKRVGPCLREALWPALAPRAGLRYGVCQTAGNNDTTSRIFTLVGPVTRMTTNLSELSGLVERHYAELYRYARRLSGSQADAEDLVQEAFLTLQAKGGQVRDPAARRAWLFRVVRNAYLQRVRSPAHAATGRLSDDLLRDLCDPASLEPEALDFDGEALQQALLQLPEEYRSALLLHYFRGLACREIAQQLRVPLGTVLSRISRGKAALRGLLCPAPVSVGATTPGATPQSTVSPPAPAPSASGFPLGPHDHE